VKKIKKENLSREKFPQKGVFWYIKLLFMISSFLRRKKEK